MGKGLCDRFQRLQNIAGRIITFSDYYTRCADILQDLGRDTLEQRRSKQLAVSVFKYLNNLYPEERVETNLHGSFLQRTRCQIRGASNNVPRSRT